MNQSTTSVVESPSINNNKNNLIGRNQHTLPPPEDHAGGGGDANSYRSTEYGSRLPNSSCTNDNNNNICHQGNSYYYYENASRSDEGGSSRRRRLIVPEDEDDPVVTKHRNSPKDKKKKDKHHVTKKYRGHREHIEESVLSQDDDDDDDFNEDNIIVHVPTTSQEQQQHQKYIAVDHQYASYASSRLPTLAKNELAKTDKHHQQQKQQRQQAQQQAQSSPLQATDSNNNSASVNDTTTTTNNNKTDPAIIRSNRVSNKQHGNVDHHRDRNHQQRAPSEDDRNNYKNQNHKPHEEKGNNKNGNDEKCGSISPRRSPLSTPPKSPSKRRQQLQKQQQQRSPQISPSSYNLRNNNTNNSGALSPASGTVELALELEAIGGTNNNALVDNYHYNFRTGNSSSSSASSLPDQVGDRNNRHRQSSLQASSGALSHRSDQQQQQPHQSSGNIRTIARQGSSSLQTCSQNNSHGNLRNHQTSPAKSPVSTAMMMKKEKHNNNSNSKSSTTSDLKKHQQKKKEVRIAGSPAKVNTTNDDTNTANTNDKLSSSELPTQSSPMIPFSSSAAPRFDDGQKNDEEKSNNKKLLSASVNSIGGDSSSSHTTNNSAEGDGSSDGYVTRLLAVVPGRTREDMLSSSVMMIGDPDSNNQNDDDNKIQQDRLEETGEDQRIDDFSSPADHRQLTTHLATKQQKETVESTFDSSKKQKDDQKEQEEEKLERVVDELEEFAADSEKAKRFYREVLDQPFSAVVVISAQNTQIVWVNSHACTMFNLVETDMVGKDISILMGNLPVPDKKAFHQAKIASFMSLWQQKKTMPESKVASGRVLELPCCRYDDSKLSTTNFTAELVVRPISMTQATPQCPPQAFVGFFRDITTEKNMILQLDQQETTVDNTSGATIIADTFGTIKHINKAACKLFGYAAKFLIDTEANIKMLMPEKFAREHDKYLKTFREKLKMPGYDLRKSWVIEKELALPARRSDGSEIEMAIKIHYCRDRTGEGHDRLVAYVRDRKALIKAQEVKSEIQRRVFPESIAKVLSQKSQTSKNNDIRHVQTYHNIPVIMIDIVDFVGISQRLLGSTTNTTAANNEAIYQYLTSFFDSITAIAADFQIEIVKTNADGVIGVCGIDEFDDRRSRVDRIVCFGLEVLRWCQGEDRQVRVGVGYGEVGSAVFEISKGRPTFDVWSSAINFASRCEKYADPQSIQITAQAFKHISTTTTAGESSVASLFKPRVYKNGIKGMQEEGTQLVTYVTPKNLDHFSTAELTEHVKATCLSRLFLKKENARQLQEQQDRRTKNRGLAA